MSGSTNPGAPKDKRARLLDREEFLIRQSFKKAILSGKRDAFGKRLVKRLGELDPRLLAAFGSHEAIQREALMMFVESIIDKFGDIGKHHASRMFGGRSSDDMSPTIVEHLSSAFIDALEFSSGVTLDADILVRFQGTLHMLLGGGGDGGGEAG